MQLDFAINAQEAPRREVAPGLFVRDLWRGPAGQKAQLVEIAPGASYPGIEKHAPGPEECFVVSGIFNDGTRDHAAGSFLHCPAGSEHVPQSATGCTLFLFYPEG